MAETNQTNQTNQPELTPKLFDRSQQFKCRIIAAGGEVKEVLTSFPTDAQWCDRHRRMVAFRRSTAAGTKIDVPAAESATIALYQAVTLSPEVKVSSAEAQHIIGKLEECQIEEVTRTSEGFNITMRVAKNRKVSHHLSIPSLDQIFAYSSKSSQLMGQRHHTEQHSYLEPAGELWDKLVIGTTGYAEISSAVPVIHKDTALGELILQTRQLTEGDDPED